MQRPRSVAGDPAQDVGKFGVAQRAADGWWLSVPTVEIGGGLRILAEVWIGQEQGVQALADREAVLGQPDGRLEEARPGQLAVLGVRHFEHAHGTRHADCAPTDDGFVKMHRLTVGLDEQRFADRRRRRLATVEGHRRTPVVVQQQGAAADAAGLGFDQGQHHLRGDRRVHRRAAGLEHRQSGGAGQWMRAGDGELPTVPPGLRADAGGAFRLPYVGSKGVVHWRRRRRTAAAADQHGGNDSEAGESHGDPAKETR
jgi:hypothetical protein